MLGIVQPDQPGLQSSHEAEALLSLLGSQGYVVLCMGEALGIGAVHGLQTVHDSEYGDRGELFSH